MSQGIVEVDVQTNFEGNTQAYCCISQDAVEAAIHTDSMIT